MCVIHHYYELNGSVVPSCEEFTCPSHVYTVCVSPSHPPSSTSAPHHSFKHLPVNYPSANRQDHLILLNLEISPTCVCIKPMFLNQTATNSYHYVYFSVFKGIPHLAHL